MVLEGHKLRTTRLGQYPAVGTPQYRRSALVGPMANGCEPVLRPKAAKYQGEIIAREIIADRVQVLEEVDPQFGIHRLVKNRQCV
jgi:putative transposase